MTTTPVIRPRTMDDLPVLAAVLVRVHAIDGYPVEGVDNPESWLQHPAELSSWTAEVNGNPVGQISLIRADAHDDAARVWQDATGGNIADLSLIVRLFVDTTTRGTGAASLLMNAATGHARHLGLAVALDVMDKDQAAIRLYRRHGARLIGTVTHRHSGDQSEPAQVYEIPT